MEWTDLDQAYLDIFGEHPDVPPPRTMSRVQELELLVASGFTQEAAEDHLVEREAIAARIRAERDGDAPVHR